MYRDRTFIFLHVFILTYYQYEDTKFFNLVQLLCVLAKLYVNIYAYCNVSVNWINISMLEKYFLKYRSDDTTKERSSGFTRRTSGCRAGHLQPKRDRVLCLLSSGTCVRTWSCIAIDSELTWWVSVSLVDAWWVARGSSM